MDKNNIGNIFEQVYCKDGITKNYISSKTKYKEMVRYIAKSEDLKQREAWDKCVNIILETYI